MRKIFRKLLDLDEAKELLYYYYKPKPFGDELVSLNEAYGRVLYEDIIAPIDVPGFDRAAMDGYAVKAEDTFGASSSNPIDFKIVGSMDIIGLGKVKVEQGETVGVVTGSPITEGANAVVMLEHTLCKRDIVEVYSSVHPSQNVTKKGEDIRIGE